MGSSSPIFGLKIKNIWNHILGRFLIMPEVKNGKKHLKMVFSPPVDFGDEPNLVSPSIFRRVNPSVKLHGGV